MMCMSQLRHLQRRQINIMNKFNFSNSINLSWNKILGFALITLFAVGVHSIYIANAANAIVSEKLPDNKVFNDFVVGPGKIEMELAPGETGTFDLMISNRLGSNKDFVLSLEDFAGSDKAGETVVLLGSDRGPYSLRDYVSLGAKETNIEHGTRVRIPVSVSVPKNAEPGGLYGSVIVGTMSKAGDVQNPSGVISTNPVFTRIGVLIFIRVKGTVNENGKLTGFGLAQNKKIISGMDPVLFNLFFKK